MLKQAPRQINKYLDLSQSLRPEELLEEAFLLRRTLVKVDWCGNVRMEETFVDL